MFLEGSALGYVSEMVEMFRRSAFYLDEFACQERVKNVQEEYVVKYAFLFHHNQF